MTDWIKAFFQPSDKKVKDVCPVCKTLLDKSYLRLERIYWCSDCEWIVYFHPGETEPHMIKKKKSSHLDKPYTPYEEDRIWDFPPSDQS